MRMFTIFAALLVFLKKECMRMFTIFAALLESWFSKMVMDEDSLECSHYNFLSTYYVTPSRLGGRNTD